MLTSDSNSNQPNLQISKSSQIKCLVETISKKKNDIFSLNIFEKVIIQLSNVN